MCGLQGRWACPCERSPVYCGDACAARHWGDNHRNEHIGVKGKRTRGGKEDDDEEGSVSDPDTPLTLVDMAGKPLLTVPWKFVKQCRTLKDLMEDNPESRQIPVPRDLSASTLSKVFEVIQNHVPDFDTIQELFQCIVALEVLGVTVSDDIYERIFKMITYRFGRPFETVEDYQAFFGNALNLPFPPEVFVNHFIQKQFPMYMYPSRVLKIYDLNLRASLKNAIRNYMLDYFKENMPHLKDPEDSIRCLRHFGDTLVESTESGRDVPFFDGEKVDKEFIRSWKGYRYPYSNMWVMDAIIARLGSFEAWQALVKGVEDRYRENYEHLKAKALERGFRIDFHFSDKQKWYEKDMYVRWLKRDDFQTNVENYQQYLTWFLNAMETIVQGTGAWPGFRWSTVYEYTTPEKYLEIAKKYKK